MDNRQADSRREVQEAISAADDAIRHLEDAERELKSARNWGIYDILGGGLISSLIKRGEDGPRPGQDGDGEGVHPHFPTGAAGCGTLCG